MKCSVMSVGNSLSGSVRTEAQLGAAHGDWGGELVVNGPCLRGRCLPGRVALTRGALLIAPKVNLSSVPCEYILCCGTIER